MSKILYLKFFTLKNCFYWQNHGKHILWSHIQEVYRVGSERELRRTKLTHDHIYPDAFSRMKVNLAVQVST